MIFVIHYIIIICYLISIILSRSYKQLAKPENNMSAAFNIYIYIYIYKTLLFSFFVNTVILSGIQISFNDSGFIFTCLNSFTCPATQISLSI